MRVLRHLILIWIVVFVVGCQTRLSRDYLSGIAKHPFRLHLSCDGTYSFEHMYMTDTPVELGRWWRVQDSVVMLVPDDTTKPQWFARVGKAGKAPLMQFRRSTDVREILKGSTP